MRVSIGPGTHGVHPHAGPRHLAGRGLGQANHSVLRGDIGGHPGRCDQARHRGGIHDRTALLLQHHRQYMTETQEHPLHVDAHHRIEHRLVVFRGWRDIALDARIVVEAIDRAVGVERRLHIGLHVGGFRHIGGDEQRLAALLTDDARGAFAAGGVAIHHDDLGAIARKAERGGTTDAITGAGDQRDLALEVHGGLPTILLIQTVIASEAKQSPPKCDPGWRLLRCFAPNRNDKSAHQATNSRRASSRHAQT